MKVSKEIKEYGTWGKCIHITNGEKEIYVTIDFGPQIIRYGFVGKENMFFEDENHNMMNPLPAEGTFKYDKWSVFGGHRLWISPESYPQTYYPAFDPVEYELIETGCIVRQGVQEYTNMQTQMKIEMNETGDVTIEHKLTNKNAWPVCLAPWAITVMSQGGTEVILQPTKNTGVLGNRLIALWPYTKLTDKRVTWGDKYIILKQDPTEETSFKLGINGEKGCAAYFNKGCVFVKKHTHFEGETYPDGGMSYETYTDKHLLEMESVAPLKTLNPDEFSLHTEKWQLFEGKAPDFTSEEDIEKTLREYL